MGHDKASDVADAVGAPGAESEDTAGPWWWVAPVVAGGVVLSPILVPLALAWAYLALVLVGLPWAALDETVSSTPFTPGLWESRDAEFWVELRPDGTGTIRLFDFDPSKPTEGSPRGELVLLSGDVTWKFTPTGNGTRGSLDVQLGDGYDPLEGVRLVHLDGGGAGYGGYDWGELWFATGDRDNTDLTLYKVESR